MQWIFRPKLFQCLKTYDKQTLSKDIMAGVIVGIVAIPLAIAFGIASGVGPIEGLITACVAGLFVSAFGGSRVQIGGPTGAFIVIVFGVIQQHGLAGLMVATIIAGVILILMGVLQLGSIIKFVPYPIILGFTAGIAIVLFSTQVNDFFGLGLTDVPSNFIDKWICYFTNITHVDWYTFGVAMFSLLVIIFFPKINKQIPPSLVAIILSTLLVWVLKNYAGVASIATIGDLYTLPDGLPKPTLPTINLAENQTYMEWLQNLFPSAFTIAILGAIESLLSAMVADGVIGDQHDSNTELIAQGLANVVTPFVGGIPATGAIARTMTNINNGGRTPVAGIIHAVVLLLVILFLGNLVALIPMPCLAAVLLMVAYNMSGWRSIVGQLKNKQLDSLVMLLTLVLTVVFDLTVAIEIGMLLALVLFVRRTSQATSIRMFTKEIDPNEDTDMALHEEKLTIPKGVEVYEIDGPYFFGIANKFDDMVKWVGKPPMVRVIRMRKVPFMDATGVHNLETFCQRSQKDGTIIILSGVIESVREVLQQAGFEALLGKENICPNIHVALQRASEIVSE